jgi:hypothetical protein
VTDGDGNYGGDGGGGGDDDDDDDDDDDTGKSTRIAPYWKTFSN